MGVLYLSRDVFRFIWRDFRAGHFLSIFLIGAIMVVGMIASGYLILAALAGLIGGFFVKIIEKTEDNSKKQTTGECVWRSSSRVWLEKEYSAYVVQT
jgi:hypothetical protein